MLIVSERLRTGGSAGRTRVLDAPGAEPDLIPRGSAPRVLVIEDTPVHLLLIRRALSKRGVQQILSASSGAEALAILRQARDTPESRPDLILLDLQLPGVSGLHVLLTIKSMPALKAIPVVVLSCSDSQTDVSRCMAAGADAFASKAEDYEAFRECVFEIIDWWNALRGG